MLRFLHALFILAVLINLIKGAELALRPHQEKWLKSKLETLALWLDYTRPIEWYMRPENTRAVYLLSHSIVLFTGSFLFLRSINYSSHGTFSIILHSLGLTMVLSMFRLGYELRTDKDKTRFQIEQEQRERELREWMWRHPTILNYLIRQLILSIAGVTVIVALIAFIPILLIIWVKVQRTAFAPIQLLLFTIVCLAVVYRKMILLVVLPLGNIGILATFNFVLTILIIITEVTLKLLRGFVWRVVEYNRGPVAAFTLAITVLLGIAEAYFKFFPQ